MPTEFRVSPEKIQQIYRATRKDISASSGLAAQATQQIEQAISNESGIECKAGCSYCCHLRVEVQPIELLAVFTYLTNEMSTSLLQKVRQNIETQYLISKNMSVIEHARNNVQCPLLVENKCSAYAARPTACASYHSLSKSDCKTAFEEPGDTNLTVWEKKTVKFLTNNIQYQLAQNCDGPEAYDLIAGLQTLFNDPNALERWRKGKPILINPD